MKAFSFFKSFCMSCALLVLFAPAFARADDPLPLDNSQWISFDHYKEAIAHGQNPLPDALSNTSQVHDATLTPAATDADILAAQKPAEAGTPAETAKTETGTVAIAAPTRPINPPVMPGMNKIFDIKVTSTTDDKQPSAQITNIDTKPTIHLPSANWQSAVTAAKQNTNADQDDDRPPLNIRYSSLPNESVAPVGEPVRQSYRDRTQAKKSVPKAEPAADSAACAAIDAYKKHQLEALQSDRATLAALQAAIKQMGLQKELSFMTGAQGSVDQADNQAGNGSAAKIDMPPDLAAAPKN